MRYLLLVTIGCVAAGLAGCAATAAPAPVAEGGLAAPQAAAVTQAPAPTAEPQATAPAVLDRMMKGPNDVTYLTEEEAAAADAGGVGQEEAKAQIIELYGEEWEGRPQIYEFKGLAENQGEVYYAFSWTEQVQEEDGVRDSDLGYLYVSLDGQEVLAGEADYIYSQGGG